LKLGEAGIGSRIGYLMQMIWPAMAMAREMVYLGCYKFTKSTVRWDR